MIAGECDIFYDGAVDPTLLALYFAKHSNFDLLKPIGQGAYGEVWLARDVNHLHTDRYRAIKVVRQGGDEHVRSYQREYEGVERYEPVSREHEGLIDVLQVGLHEDQGFFFYVMELADDCETCQEINPDSYRPKTLGNELEARGRLPFDECVKVAGELAQGLAFLHGRKLVHRDIKPANILCVNGQWKYADTGLVADPEKDNTSVGSLGYLPPEGSGKPAADIFSLGKVLYQICTGMDCHEFPDLPPGFEELDDPLFRRLNSIYLKACEYNPELRCQDATEITSVLANSEDTAESTINPSLSPEYLVQITLLDEEGVEVGSFSLEEGEHVIGRKGYGNKVSIEDKSVSRRHAKLVVADGQLKIEDLKSTYGTSKEGKQITGRIPVHPGEKVRVGKHFIQLDAGAQTIAPTFEEKPTLGSGRYTFLKKLGQGTFGEVWRMWDNELNEDVAAKFLTEDMVNESAITDFKREVQKTRRLSHDNIVRIFDLCSLPDDPPFLTMEFVDGCNLETQRLNRTGNIISWHELQPLMDQLCNAVGYIHDKGIVHRDIKPSNILITNEDQVKLGDFGCARSMIISRFTMGQFAEQGNLMLSGTLVYMSPQMLEGGEPAASDDIYAIGAMLYELLTGQTPFSCRQSQEDLIEEILNVSPPPPGGVLEQQGTTSPIPDHVSAMIMSCLSKDPDKRPGNAKLIMAQFY